VGVVRPNPPDTSLVSATCDKVDLRSVTPWRGVNGATLGCQIQLGLTCIAVAALTTAVKLTESLLDELSQLCAGFMSPPAECNGGGHTVIRKKVTKIFLGLHFTNCA